MSDKRSIALHFRASDLEDDIQSRSTEARSVHQVAKRDLGRYYTLLDKVRPVFTRDEAHLLVDIFNGTLFDPIEMSMGLLYASVDDAEEAYFEKHGVDRSRIVKRIYDMGPAEQLAIIDAVERFWADPEASVEGVGLCGPSEVRN